MQKRKKYAQQDISSSFLDFIYVRIIQYQALNETEILLKMHRFYQRHI